MKSKIVPLALVALAVATALAVRATREIANANPTLAALASQRDALRSKTTALEERLRTAKSALAEAKTSAATLAASRSVAEKSTLAVQASAKPTTSARQLSPSTLVTNDSKKMAEYMKNYRASLDLTLGRLFRKLNLTPVQIEKVKDLKVWFEQSRMDLQAAAELHGLDMKGDAYDKMQNVDLRKEMKQKEAEIFGSGELLARYREASSNYYLRATVQRIASSEMGSDTPATFAQAESASDIIMANAQRRAESNPNKLSWQVYGWSWQDWAEVNWAVAEPQLQAILSPVQYAALRQFLRTQETWTAVATRNAANQTEAAKLARQPGG